MDRNLVLIEGLPGSGKTWTAIELARRLAADGTARLTAKNAGFVAEVRFASRDEPDLSGAR